MNRTAKILGSACIAAILITVAGLPLRAQPPAPTQPSDQNPKTGEPGETHPNADPEFRHRWRERIQRALDARRQELDRLEAALKALDEGKTVEEVRQMYPDLPRFGNRGEGQEHGPMGDGRHTDGGDVDRLGPQMMGGGRRGGGAPGPDQAPHQLTADERQSVRDILEATSPQLFKHLQELEKSNPAEAERNIGESFPRLRFLLDLRKRDKQLYDLKLKDIRHGREAFEAARAIAELDRRADADTGERSKLEASLRSALTAQYNVRTQAMQREAEGLKERGASLKADAEKRDAQAGAVVEKNMKAMIEREKKWLEKRSDKDHHGPGDRRPAQPDKPANPPS
jgi:hypothetical protein